MIGEFRGEHRFLSNFYPAPTLYSDVVWPTSEHAYQAAKSLDPEYRAAILRAHTPGEAKKLGRKAPLRPNWDKEKLQIMTDIVTDKFMSNPELAAKLLATGDHELVEGNHWGDTFWGVCNGKGENHLGKILMMVRRLLR